MKTAHSTNMAATTTTRDRSVSDQHYDTRNASAEALKRAFEAGRVDALPGERERLLRDVVQRDDGCAVWRGKTVKGLYPRVSLLVRPGRGVDVLVRRALWVLHQQRPIPAGARITTTCATPLCVNPAHLVVATAKEVVDRAVSEGKIKPLCGWDGRRRRSRTGW